MLAQLEGASAGRGSTAFGSYNPEACKTLYEHLEACQMRDGDEWLSQLMEKDRMLATLASAQARRRMSEAIDGLSVDADMRALEGVREHIAKISTESSLDREIGADQVRTRIRAIRDEVRDEAARRELAELKEQLAPSLSEVVSEAAIGVQGAAVPAAT